MAEGWSHLHATQSEFIARAELISVGYPGEHWEVGTWAIHLRKRLTDTEIEAMGGVCPHQLAGGL